MSNTVLIKQEKELLRKLEDHFPQGISSDILQQWIGLPKEELGTQLRDFFAAGPKQAKAPQALLALVNGEIVIPATATPLKAAGFFQVGKNGIVYLGDNFQEKFLGKIEEPGVAHSLRSQKLLKGSVDGHILPVLGDNAETTLTDIAHLITLQSKGQKGALLVNGYANIFYVRIEGVLWAVSVRWDYWGGGCGWYVNAYSVENPYSWNAGRQVFSRNSVS